MAIGLIQFLPGVESESFGRLIDELVADGGPIPAEGNMFHISGPIEGGWQVVDIWESREHFDRFREARQAPAMEKAGGIETRVTDFPIEAQFVADGWPGSDG